MKSSSGEKLKVPPMGLNQVYQIHHLETSTTKPHALWQGIEDGARFYYVHSYYVKTDDEQMTAGFSEYPNRFTSAIAKDNLFAVQFHPEKSASAGLQMLSNFVNWTP